MDRWTSRNEGKCRAIRHRHQLILPVILSLRLSLRICRVSKQIFVDRCQLLHLHRATDVVKGFVRPHLNGIVEPVFFCPTDIVHRILQKIEALFGFIHRKDQAAIISSITGLKLRHTRHADHHSEKIRLLTVLPLTMANESRRNWRILCNLWTH